MNKTKTLKTSIDKDKGQFFSEVFPTNFSPPECKTLTDFVVVFEIKVKNNKVWSCSCYETIFKCEFTTQDMFFKFILMQSFLKVPTFN